LLLFLPFRINKLELAFRAVEPSANASWLGDIPVSSETAWPICNGDPLSGLRTAKVYLLGVTKEISM
jgi:hypothetical protein